MNEVLYITDLVIINKDFAEKLKQNHLEGTFIMVRGYHEPEYWTSEQIEIEQPKISGFLEVDKLIELCMSTKWTTYKIYQAVKNGELAYREPYFMKADTKIKVALAEFITTQARFAVVRQYPKELGMVSEAAIREVLERLPGQYAEEVKEDTFTDLQRQYHDWKRRADSSARGSSFLSNLNRSIRHSYGREFGINNSSLSQEIAPLNLNVGSFCFLPNGRLSDQAGVPRNMTHSNFIGSLESLVLPALNMQANR